MKLPLHGQFALVTGAAQRIGRAIALALAEQGADLVLHCNHSMEQAAATAEVIRATGVNCRVVQCDLADPRQSATLLEQARTLAGAPIDILINNASVFHQGQVVAITPEEFALNMNIHALSPLLLSQTLAEQNNGGQIINILDTRILECDIEHAAYHLSKRALFTLTRMLAKELAPEIRVNGVAPGAILPPPGKDAAYLKVRATSIPLRRHGSVQDITDAVIYLCQASFITGQVIYVDGGQHIGAHSYDA
ncbi:MAG: SDR family oxidoreductase [Kiritimatiellae bacterium]|nr:SDR family oxidoreductase [Kiritimatiellia bacterium]